MNPENFRTIDNSKDTAEQEINNMLNRNEIYEEVLIQHMSEFEEKISKYFSKYTGLHLYVHDIIYRRD